MLPKPHYDDSTFIDQDLLSIIQRQPIIARNIIVGCAGCHVVHYLRL